MSKKYNAPKYPRIMVSPKRHKELAQEAQKRNVAIMEVAEERLAKK